MSILPVRALAVSFAFALAACGGSTSGDTGTNGGGGNAAGSGGESGAAGSAGAAGNGGAGLDGGTDASPITGSWTGYVENYKFDDGTDVLDIDVGSVQGQAVTGQVTLGSRAPYGPPTDPNAGYPPGWAPTGGGMAFNPTALSGFAFTIQNGSFDGQRLQFDVAPAELWSVWCAMQTPIADEANPGSYSCVHNWGFQGGSLTCQQLNPQTNQYQPIDCSKLALCSGGGACGCTAQGCEVALGTTVHFDVNVTAPTASGSVVGLDGSVHNVHLTKQ